MTLWEAWGSIWWSSLRAIIADACLEGESSTPQAREAPNSDAACRTVLPVPLPKSAKTSSGPSLRRCASWANPSAVISPYVAALLPPIALIIAFSDAGTEASSCSAASIRHCEGARRRAAADADVAAVEEREVTAANGTRLKLHGATGRPHHDAALTLSRASSILVQKASEILFNNVYSYSTYCCCLL